MGVKRLEVLREIIPDLARVAVLWANLPDAASSCARLIARRERDR
jgi:hypothetical protein